MTNFEKSLTLIKTIGEQWPFLLVVFIIIIVIIKWKTLWSFVERLNKVKFKSGNSEIELSEDKSSLDDSTETAKRLKQTDDVDNSVEKNEIPKTLFDIYLKLSDEKFDEAKLLFQEIQNKTDEPKKTENKFVFLFYEFINGVSSAEEELLKEIQNENINDKQKSLGYKYLGLCYKNINQFEKAIDAFQKSIEISKEPELIVECTILKSNCFIENNDSEKAIEELLTSIKTTNNDKLKSKIYVELSKVYDKLEEKTLKSIALEKALYNNSNDVSLMFDVAYSYSETDFENLSIFHYLNLIKIRPNHNSALNNLGVGLKNKGLPIESVNYYKQAVKNNESLAAANLAYLYIESGFEEEANSLFKEFIIKPDVHKNLISAQSTLINNKEQEKKKVSNIKADGFALSKFFKKYASSYFEESQITNIKNNNWVDNENNKISVRVDNNIINISWNKYNAKLEDDDIFNISGNLHNQACEIEFSVPITKTPGLLSSIYDPFSTELKTNSPYREFIKYKGYMTIDIKKGEIELFYIKDKQIIFKLIKQPSA